MCDDMSFSNTTIQLRDIPALLQDFITILLRLERCCITTFSQEISIHNSQSIQIDYRICCSLNERLYGYFYPTEPAPVLQGCDSLISMGCDEYNLTNRNQSLNYSSSLMRPITAKSLDHNSYNLGCSIDSTRNACSNSRRDIDQSCHMDYNSPPSVQMRAASFQRAESMRSSSYRPSTSSASGPSSVSPDVTFLTDKLKNDYDKIRQKLYVLSTTYFTITETSIRSDVIPPEKVNNAFSYQRNLSRDMPTPFQPLLSDNATSSDANGCNNYNNQYQNKEGYLKLWNTPLDLQIRSEQLQELLELRCSVETLKALQIEMNVYTHKADDHLAEIQEICQSTETQSRDAAIELAKASKAKTRWWLLSGSGAGALAGGLSGLTLGPIGFLVGASFGGIVGVLGSREVRKMHKKRMDWICRQSVQPMGLAERPPSANARPRCDVRGTSINSRLLVNDIPTSD